MLTTFVTRKTIALAAMNELHTGDISGTSCGLIAYYIGELFHCMSLRDLHRAEMGATEWHA